MKRETEKSARPSSRLCQSNQGSWVHLFGEHSHFCKEISSCLKILPAPINKSDVYSPDLCRSRWCSQKHLIPFHLKSWPINKDTQEGGRKKNQQGNRWGHWAVLQTHCTVWSVVERNCRVGATPAFVPSEPCMVGGSEEGTCGPTDAALECSDLARPGSAYPGSGCVLRPPQRTSFIQQFCFSRSIISQVWQLLGIRLAELPQLLRCFAHTRPLIAVAWHLLNIPVSFFNLLEGKLQK